MKKWTWLGFMLAVFCCAGMFVARADGQANVPMADPAVQTAAQLIGRALFLRCLCTAETVSFDENGHVVREQKTRPVDWTLAGVDVQKVVRKDADTVELQGVRAAVRWVDDRKEFDRKPLKYEPVRLELRVSSDAEAAQRALGEMFSLGIDHRLQAAMPAFWQHYFNPALPWPEDSFKAVTYVLAGSKVDGVEVPAPAVRHKVEVEFTVEARHDRVQGDSVLFVEIDPEGKAHHLRVVQPLGYGLDAQAAKATAGYSFAVPASVNGKQMTVGMLVKQQFSIVAVPQP